MLTEEHTVNGPSRYRDDLYKTLGLQLNLSLRFPSYEHFRASLKGISAALWV